MILTHSISRSLRPLGLGQGSVKGPLFKAPVHCPPCNANGLRPTGLGFCFTPKGDVFDPPRILPLLKPGRPPGVFRGISLIVVDALNRVAICGPRPHVGVERSKVIYPSSTNTNAATAVIVEKAVVRIRASVLHVLPAMVFRAATFCVRPIRRALTTSQLAGFAKQAAAAFRVASPECALANHLFGAAITLTEAGAVRLFCTINRKCIDDNQSSVSHKLNIGKHARIVLWC